MSSHMLQVAALGESFTLGTLYNAHTNHLIPGLSLWDLQAIQDHTVESLQHSSAFQISSSDSTESKASLLDIDASLKASFLSGLVEVNGSAKYLKDKKQFKNQSRVTFQYSATTNFKQLTVTHLSVDTSVMEKSSATHVVTGILYGANAFFVFDSQKLDDSQAQDIHGKMEAVVKKIPSFNVEGTAEVKLTDEEKALVQNFSCTFHGDFILESNPTTFVEAIKTYVELPKLLGDKGENTVPVKVWLMPLKNLASGAPELVRGISVGLVRKMQDGLEDVKKMETRCNDSMVDKVGEDFPQIQEDLQRFQRLCQNYTSNLQRAMKQKLPSIREGKEDESSLKQLLDGRDQSPFSHAKLLKWLQTKEREINIIRCCFEILEGVKIVQNQSELDREVLNPSVKHTFCFVFTSLINTDPYLGAMDQYLDHLKSGIFSDDPWYYSDDVFTRIREKARAFYNLNTKSKTDKRFCFLVASIKNEKHVGATIYHYKDTILVSEDFSPPDISNLVTIKDKQVFSLYAFELAVDLDTVSRYLTLSEGNMKVIHGWGELYPENPRRFHTPQLMCREELTGCHYWEVERRSKLESEAVTVGVAYEIISRRAGSIVGSNADSWGLSVLCEPAASLTFAQHDGKIQELPFLPGCTRFGVFLDCSGGSLSFYMVSSGTLTHLFTFNATFTDPVYPAFFVGQPSNYINLRQVD